MRTCILTIALVLCLANVVVGSNHVTTTRIVEAIPRGQSAVFHSWQSFEKSAGLVGSPRRRYANLSELIGAQPVPPKKIKASLPAFFQTYYGSNLVKAGIAEDVLLGPNCFNTALKFNQPDLKAEATKIPVFLDVLAEDYSLLPNKSGTVQLQKGDIVTLWLRHRENNTARPIHTAVYLSESWFFGKEFFFGNDPYEITRGVRQFISYDNLLMRRYLERSKKRRLKKSETFLYTVHRLR